METIDPKSFVEEQDLPALKKQQIANLEELGYSRIGEMSTCNTTDIRSSRIGVGFETLDRFMFDPDRVYPLMEKLGAKWARVQTGWSRCETEKGRYDFAWLEEIVDNLLRVGVEPFFCVSFGNQLYMPDVPHESAVGYVPLYYGEEGKAAWVDYVRALGECFRGKVRFWEVWNEPNIPQFWHPSKPDGAEYAELVKVTAAAVRESIPDAKIVGGAMSKMDPPFLEAALKAGLTEEIDVFSFHPYQSVPEANLQNMHDLVRRLLKQYSGGKVIDVWQGENGCPSQTAGHNDDWLGLYDTDEVVQAKWVARRVLADLKAGFDMSLYFHAIDLMGRPYRQADGGVKKPVMMGLINGATYEPKYSFEVFQRVCSLFDDESERRELFYRFLNPDEQHPQQSGVLATAMGVSFVRSGCPLLAFWNTADPQQKMPAQSIDLVFWSDSDLQFEKPVLADLMTGQVYDLSGHGEPFICDDAHVGMKFRLPFADYPLVLTDASLFPEIS
ncbi:GH39 family glycosyl hydrolase [Puniceicoccus vermicola]|uniref:Beta-galactosidase n=1 Tax=Puniceicoccus vermicola TaxID=388746 RepID=A0A7X1AZB5_9BACT|nr:beta-galactosidase [Puniceicoccus vermicola]MBC2602727.1 beta-galactosidase [Puniceicoccus vermicola]